MIDVYQDLVYAGTAERPLRLDLRVPRGLPAPLVVYLPVSGMRSCERSTTPWWLTHHGFAMASLEVRVFPEVIAPITAYDCKAGVRFLRAHAERYRYQADAIGVWGHSAGGNLSSLLATSGDLPALEGDGPHAGVSSRVQAACDECGAPHDFAWLLPKEVQSKFPLLARGVRDYLGGRVEERADLARVMSPQTHVSRAGPPMLLIHGEADVLAPVEETARFYHRFRAASVDATLKVLPGVGHDWEARLTCEAISSFFARTLRP